MHREQQMLREDYTDERFESREFSQEKIARTQ